nr:DUF6105 family protein [uncultured Gellertiella sp.]
MKWFLLLWGGPIVLLGTWYGLSYYDMNFGFFMLRRETNDLVFQLYGKVLGLPPQILPALVMKAVIVDSLVLFSIIGFRRRKDIRAWWQGLRGEGQAGRGVSDESLSSAP